jgi:hypothetical protein
VTAARPLAVVPDKAAPPPLPDGARRVPGSAGWAYRPGRGIWRLPSSADQWELVLSWCPYVVDAVRYPAQDGRTIATAYKVTIRDQTEVVSAGDLLRGTAWPRFHNAHGFTGRQISDVLVNIVTAQASGKPDIIGYPCFDNDGRLRLPPTEYLPDGYTNGEGSKLAALRALVAAVAPYPVAALQMGLSALAPWIGPLELQPFTLHTVGDSTVGKSTGLYAAAALWWVAYRRVAPPWAGTKIGIPGSFRDLGALPAFRDELGTAGLGPADRAVLFTNIMEGCRRIARTRDDLARPSASWASACLSTGNISAVPASHASAGTPKGVIEVHADGARPVIPPEAKARVRRVTNAREMAGAWVPYAARLPLERVRHDVERADKDLGGQDADGLAWHMARAMSVAVAGARILAELTGVAELAASAELAARQVIADTEDRLAEIGADHGARLAETVAELVDAYPSAFGLGEASGRIEQIGFLAQTQDGAELVCIYRNRHADIARRAEVEDVTSALRQLRDSGQIVTSAGQGLKYRARRAGRLVSVIAYNLNVETGQNTKNTQNNAGQGPNSCSDQAPDSSEHRSEQAPEPASEPGWGPDTVGAEMNGERAPLADVSPPAAGPVATGSGPLTVRIAGKVHPAVKCPGCDQLGPVSLAVNGYHVGCAPDDPDAPVSAGEPLPGMAELAEPPSASARTTSPDPTGPEPESAEPARRKVTDLTAADELEIFARSVRKPELYPEASDEDVSAALAIFHEVTGGGRYVSFAGQTGQALFARQLARFPSMVAPTPVESTRAREVWKSGMQTRANFVTRGLRVRPGLAFTGFDINGQFPAAAGSAELGDGEPEIIDSPRMLGDLANLPGYIRLARAVRTGHPAFGTLAADTWQPMPFVKYLTRDEGLTIPAAEVIYWPHKGKRLAVYVKYAYREPRDRLAAMPDSMPVRLAKAALKDQANAFIGMLHSEKYSKGGFYRPDWYDMIVSTAEANALRALGKCETPPVAKIADTAYWVAPSAPYTPAGLIVSGQLGKWKLERYGPVTAELADTYRAKDASARTIHEIAKRIDAERRAQ